MYRYECSIVVFLSQREVLSALFGMSGAVIVSNVAFIFFSNTVRSAASKTVTKD